jgi:hypothetical protein
MVTFRRKDSTAAGGVQFKPMNDSPTRPIRKKTAASAAPDAPVWRSGLTRLAWWVWPLGAALGAAALLVVWVFLLAAPLPSLSAEAVPPYFTVYPPPTFTPFPPTSTPTPIFTPSPVVPTVMPGTIGVGGMVEVTEDGLRLRDAPSLKGKILNQASAHELFKIVDGPRSADGYTWWLLQGVYDATRQGWAVENYLKPS